MKKKPTYEELEQRLKELEQTTFEHNRLMSILNAIPDGVYIVSQQNDIEYINPVIEQEFGPVDKRKCYEYFHGRTEVCPWCKNAEVHAGKSVNWEWHSKRNNRYYELFDTPITNTDGSISKFEIFHDITDLKRTEKKLRESENKHRTLYESMVQGVVYQDRTGSIISANPAAERILGLTFDQMVGRTSVDPRWKTIHEDSSDFPGDTHPAMVSLKTGKRVNNVIMGVFNPQDKNYTWINTNSFPRFNTGENEPYQVYTTFEDITDRKNAEKRLRQNEKWLKGFFEHIADYVLVLEPVEKNKLIIVDCNEAACKKHGYLRNEILGKPITILDDNPLPLDEKRVERLMAGKTVTFEVIHKKKDNSTFPAEATVKLFEIDGRLNFISIERDISERKQVEKEKEGLENRLIQAQKMEAIGTLAGGIAHDFNNILAAMLGYAEMARDDIPPETTVAKDLDKVLEGGNRAKDLVQQILAFSRQNEMECNPLQPASVVKEILKMLRPSLPTTIEINQDITSVTSLILADPTQIHQILMNLCTNAFHAMEETGGKLDISLKEVTLSSEDLVNEPDVEAGAFVQLSISDSGSGIPPDIKKKIFDPYFTTKETGKGTGMGLAIVHGIVKSYRGFISLYSEPQEGTAFHVFLPVIEQEHLPEIEDVKPIPVGWDRILFIDDEEILAEMGKSMLERLGYHVTVRNNSIEALETFQNQPDQFDLVITDQTMPGMTGADIARRMIQIKPDIPIILCTGYSSVISEEKAKSIGIKEFALKPLSKKVIAALIRKVLDSS
ncbi:MAG: PAS domain S-box protein [Desulfobulbaceae bacterium]|nr:PAS domain S-box protein [Desulfobulbaceae bacterium]